MTDPKARVPTVYRLGGVRAPTPSHQHVTALVRFCQ